MRFTKSASTALDRTVAAFPQLTIPAHRRAKSAGKQLAFLFDLLKREHVDRRDVHEAIRWNGPLPRRGIKGWEQEALEWGRAER